MCKKRSKIEDLYKRAIKLGKNKGLGEESEDFAGWLAIQWLEGKSQHQTLNQSFVEYRRRNHADPRNPGGLAKLIGKARTVSLTSPEGREEANFAHERSLEGRARDVARGKFFDVDPSTILSGRDAEIYRLYFKEEYPIKVIAAIYELHPNYVQQQLGKIKCRVYAALKPLIKERIKEKIEQAQTEFGIDWIAL